MIKALLFFPFSTYPSEKMCRKLLFVAFFLPATELFLLLIFPLSLYHASD